MPRSAREDVTVTKRREIVADLYLQGWNQAAIAEHLGAAQSTVSVDLKAIREHWRESSVRDFDEAREIELRKLDRVEREAWEAWERSRKPAQSVVMNTDGAEQKTSKTVKEQGGDPRFLDQVMKCVASRRALLGLDAPTKIAPTSPDGEQAYDSHVMMELMRLSEQTKDGPVVIDADYVERTFRKVTDNGDDSTYLGEENGNQ